MVPFLIRTPWGFVYTFTVVWGVTLAAVFWLRRRQEPGWWDEGLALFAGGLLGGRLAFIAANRPYFLENPADIWRPGLGGFGYFGVLFGGFFVFWLWHRLRGGSPAEPLLGAAPLIALLHAGGWAACYAEGCAFGRETFLAWYAADLPDQFGVMAVRYQTQLAGLLFALIVMFLSWRRRWPVWGTMVVLLAGHGALTYFRGDEMPLLAGMRLDTILSGVALLAAAAFGHLPIRKRLRVK